MFYHVLYPLHQTFSAFNVFRYITFRTAYAIMTALIISWLIGPYVIRLLRNLQVGQVVRDDGPQSHLSKAGTPTMGGVLLLAALGVSILLWGNLGEPYVWLVLGTTLCFGAIGFWDDYLKTVRKSPAGLRAKYKFGAEIIVAGAMVVALLLIAEDRGGVTRLSVPFFKEFTPDLGWWYILFAIIVIVGTSNAVNLTDGLDGLAIGPVIIATLAYTGLSYVAGNARFAEYLNIPHVPGAGEVAVFCGALLGASLGFLWFNSYPAQVFMGDVGSLSLGGALGMIAVLAKHELLLMIIGGLFVIETLSVIVQVASFKLTGKRVFRMAPLHHHFEEKGWQEPKVIVRFWIIAITLALLSLSTLKLR